MNNYKIQEYYEQMVSSQKINFITGNKIGFQDEPYSMVPFIRAKEYSLFLQQNEFSQLFYLRKVKPIFNTFDWKNMVASLNFENSVIFVEIPDEKQQREIYLKNDQHNLNKIVPLLQGRDFSHLNKKKWSLKINPQAAVVENKDAFFKKLLSLQQQTDLLNFEKGKVIETRFLYVINVFLNSIFNYKAPFNPSKYIDIHPLIYQRNSIKQIVELINYKVNLNE